ncbi:MAG: hypothetical protein QXX86_01445 [Sulfolobales archaeon]
MNLKYRIESRYSGLVEDSTNDIRNLKDRIGRELRPWSTVSDTVWESKGRN